MHCERCGREIYKYETCNYCGRKIGYECVKSSKSISKLVRAVICKDCWGKLPRRKQYKSATKATS